MNGAEDMLRRMAELTREPGFHAFQAELAHDMYKTLAKGYTKGDNEVKLVTHLVSACNAKAYRNRIHIHSYKIHGPRSTVRFNFREKSIPKELGDMVVISILSEGRNRILQRVSIVQNKRSVSGTWEIDPAQLFLLHHFPPFSGVKGVFRGYTDVTFANFSTALGTYGFFDAPGDMSLISAPLVAGAIGVGRTFSKEHPAFHTAYLARTQHRSWLYHPSYPDRHSPPWYLVAGAFPLERDLLGNAVCCPDICSFVRDWLQINIGDVSFWHGQTLDPALDEFSNRLVRLAGGDKFVDIPQKRREYEEPEPHGIGVLVAHVDIRHLEG